MASTRDIRLPADSLLALRRTLVREVGAPAANRALQEAGHAAGDALFDRMGLQSDGDIADTPSATFWDRLAALARELGWGVLDHETPHPGVGALTARDWFEVDDQATHPTAAFTTGILANLLGRAADGDVAVLQVSGPDGPRCVRFLFGAPGVLDRVYADIRDGADLETSLAGLG
ncbi:MAG: hypothetical protein P8177_11110 [Gemmatimonadota bacterium]|jgi:hypothetical protein